TLRLARPDKRNALNDTMMYAAIDAVDLAGRDEAVRAIFITSAGEHFCSGFDWVARNQEGGKPRAGSIQRRLPSQAHRLIPLLCTVQVPVVCAVRGWAAGIGLNLALAADFTVAAAEAEEWQMIHRAVPAAEVDATAAELVGTLAKSATVGLGLSKWLLHVG